ncbi:uncharacterized protein FOMMEDRAFT_125556 [Fomitiporia mediterranea MF3/22]|uniref:uncharacterized protein n=1 Tax=Fomitiporia mediterranea (strain MF3/22) TaxID=694068 RepID=UPI000440860B|nr:uncharacterized protein FOMMEDRAFT_125556 [Fomitiporia mediterranea MF3/22]EJD00991.1 hypothetical protein FOMMEDRAFT_125556 [Fomitiporia mediterranea MF3/22]
MLPLERPYKDENGRPIPTLLDITADGQFIYEPREEWDAKLGERFRRIFTERGVDFFDTDPDTRYRTEPDKSDDVNTANVDITPSAQADKEEDAETDAEAKQMTPEKLFHMRSEILPRLHVALGEMSHARDLLSLLLSASPAAPSSLGASASTSLLSAPSVPAAALSPSLTPGLLTSSTVSALPPIQSVQAFDAQFVTGGKDDALRKASDVLRSAAEGIERSTLRSEDYWADALRIRRSNWGLVPAPLPLGSSTGKGSDKTSRDFLVSYGLESSPAFYRRLAIAHMSFLVPSSTQDDPLVFPHRDKTRLRVSLTRKDSSGDKSTCHSQVRITPDDSLSGAIKNAQKEIVEKEIFDAFIKEAGRLPTASARVSERLIVIDAAQDVEIRFELLDEGLIASSNSSAGSSSDLTGQALCDLIASSLPVFLLRQHAHQKAVRLKLLPKQMNGAPSFIQQPRILQPIIDIIQYHVFLKRVRGELSRAASRLRNVGITVDLRFEGVGETGKVVLDALLDGKENIGGEAVLRIDGRHTSRFTFASPSMLTALLPQATITISSIPQLVQLLADEIERSLLEQICEIGVEVCQSLSGTWFVDEMMCRAVGRWEGCVLNFRIKCGDDLSLDCHAHQLLRTRPPGSGGMDPKQVTPSSASFGTFSGPAKLLTYDTREDKSLGMFAWVKGVIEDTLSSS